MSTAYSTGWLLLGLLLLLLLLGLFDQPPDPPRYSEDELEELMQSCIDIMTMEGQHNLTPCHVMIERMRSGTL